MKHQEMCFILCKSVSVKRDQFHGFFILLYSTITYDISTLRKLHISWSLMRNKSHSAEIDEANCRRPHPKSLPPKPLDQDSAICVVNRTTTTMIHCMHSIFDVRNIVGTLGCVFIDNETHESGVSKCTTGEAWSAFSWHHSSVFHCQWTHNQVFLLLSQMLIQMAKSIFIYVIKYVSGFI